MAADSKCAISGAPVEAMFELYEPLDVIGNGSFGVIRKVRRRTDGLLLARKELNYARMKGHDLKQLNEEVNVLQTLHSNDHIIRYHERYVDQQNFVLYILMEYAENGDLGSVISRCRHENTLLPEEVIWCYLTQITSALHDCHSEYNRQGVRKAVILHRDIKPENIFLDKDKMIKLGDFGLSKAMTATFATTYVGTPYYMSPELINGKEYDAKSDIWALGCLIYELCAWHPPFHEATTQAELTKLVREGHIPPLPKGYSKDLDAVVRSMLRQNPAKRPSTKQIKTLDQVRIQMRVLELHRINESLRGRRKVLDVRESEISDREMKVSARERQLEVEKIEINQDRQKLASLHSQLMAFSEHLQAQAQLTGMGPISFPSVEDAENVPPISAPSIQDPAATPKVSRPSSQANIRRPLEERRSVPNLTKRLSNCSLMSVDDTPQKPVTAHARRVASAKSLTAMVRASSNDSSPAPPLPAPAPIRDKGMEDMVEGSGSSTLSSASSQGTKSTDSGKGHSRRSRSEPPAVAQQPSSPSKRARPPMPEQMSEAAIAAIVASRESKNVSRNELDDDGIPSPFVKTKKTAILPQTSAPSSSVMAALGKVARNGIRPAPPAPSSRTTVTTRRQSFANRLRSGSRTDDSNSAKKADQPQQPQQTSSRTYSFGGATRMRRASSTVISSTS